jgi:hypothetical protein
VKQLAVLVLAVSALGVVTAGCGGSGGGSSGGTTKADYLKQMKALGTELSTSFSDLANARPTSKKSSAALLRNVGDALDAAGDKLDDIDPPAEVADAHQKLIDGTHEAADEFRDLASKLDSASPSQLPAILSQLNPSKLPGFVKMQQAVNEFKAKGYQLGQLSG